MIRRAKSSPRTDKLFPYTTLFRAWPCYCDIFRFNSSCLDEISGGVDENHSEWHESAIEGVHNGPTGRDSMGADDAQDTRGSGGGRRLRAGCSAGAGAVRRPAAQSDDSDTQSRKRRQWRLPQDRKSVE